MDQHHQQALDVHDSSLLEPLTEEALVLNLLTRFQRDQIYTLIGDVLVSVNPHKPLLQYAEEVIRAYKERRIPIGANSSTSIELPPHVYAVADSAWRSLRDQHSDQVIIITGESGSGKTEASKLILQYVSSAAGQSKELETVRHQILLSNPVLEAFGNARTGSNDNSSRFGKYVDVEFDYRGEPVGGFIHHYLLEKSRVTGPKNPGERNFHIFYQLLAGADVQLLKSLKLQRNWENYHYLRNDTTTSSSCPPSSSSSSSSSNSSGAGCHPSDKEEFLNTKRALESVGFSAEEVGNIFRLVSAVLKLGNVVFIPVSNIDGTEGCGIHNEYELEEVAKLLLIPAEDLRSALLYRTVGCQSGADVPLPGGCSSSESFVHHQQSTHRSSVISNSVAGRGPSIPDGSILADLSAPEATAARDALCKALYSRLFTWIINSINERIKVKQHGKRKVLGLLDVYGFEDVGPAGLNGLEQLIINYCDDKIHQVILEASLKEEQEEYVQEGLEWTAVPFVDNLAVCDLIEKVLLSVLDEESHRIPSGTDETFIQRLGQATCPDSSAHLQLLPGAFRVRHYAGWVTYSASGFLEKNADALDRGLCQTMFQCGHPILRDLFPEGNPRRATLRRPATTATQFKVAMSGLVRSLRTKSPHYIRCIRPNPFKRPHHFDPALVQQQVRSFALLETAQVRRNGYVFRAPYSAFLQRYKMLSSVTWPHWPAVAIEGVARLLRDLPVSATEYAFGRRKLFIKNGATVDQLEEFRRTSLHQLAILIQKTFRAWSARRLYLRRKGSQIKIATAWRRYKARSEYLELRHRRLMIAAVRIIERSFVHYKRKRYLVRLAARLPSSSPICREWPAVSPCLGEVNQILKRIYHVWRCHRYRLSFDQIGRNRMREKVTASFLFRNRKESYGRSVAHPFQGDYVRLRQNAQWRKMVSDTVDHYVVFADIVSKITRSSGRLVPVLFVVSTSSLMILDQRTLSIKYRIPAADVVRISLSPFLDDIAVFHIKSFDCSTASIQNVQTGCLQFQPHHPPEKDQPHPPTMLGNKWKGDLILQTCHVIELVTKIFLVVQNASAKAPEVNVHTDFDTSVGHQTVEVSFRCLSLPDVQPGHVRIQRRGHRLEVTL